VLGLDSVSLLDDRHALSPSQVFLLILIFFGFRFVFIMAEVIGITAGLVALLGFGVQSGQVLIQTLHSFQSRKKTVRELKTEVESLVKVLQSVQEACTETDAGFSALKLPVLECGKACKEFNIYITKIAPRSDQDRISFRDWASITMRGDSVDAFKNKLAANKATMTIALADANL
jgi:hypothetical protein